jgi:plastocyanin
MKSIFLFLMAITGLVTMLHLPHAYSDFSPDNKYLVQASGYLSGKQTIFDSGIALQLTIGTKSGSTTQATLDNGLVTIADDHYLNSGIWQTSILRDGRFLIIQGDAQDQSGNTIHLNLFGRIIDSNQDGSVYSITGKITGSETMKAIYSTKIISTNAVSTKPITIPTNQTTPTQQPSPSKVGISIVYGAFDINNQVHYSPSNVQIAAGTTIVWTNYDSVPHRIMSGIAKATTIDQSTPVFTTDGKIDSGIIAPGQSFQFTINDFDNTKILDQKVAKNLNISQNQTAGYITFFDPNYPFMIGVIVPLPQAITQGKTVSMNIVQGASNPNNALFLSPSSSLQITPGTVVVWTNYDSVPHRIMSGQLLPTTESGGGKGITGKPNPHFISDGKIDSNVIAPGQHYEVTISNTGSIQFYDPSFTWINGIIISSPTTTTQITPVQISIAPGSSLKGTSTQQQYNQYNSYYYPDTIQIVPGTTITWVNNDSIDHTILSGISTQKNENPFIPDGRIVSGNIAPGQTFTVVITDTGIIRFYDPQYTWMNGVIISMPPTSSYTIGAKSYNPGLH